MSRTGMLIHPTLDEVLRQAAIINLPRIEAEKFFYFYDSKGWKVGKTAMKSFPSALAGWKLRWEEREREKRGINGHSVLGRQVAKAVKGIE